MVACIPDFENAEFSFYRYVPSQAAAIIFAGLFGILILLHLFQMIRSRTWYMTALIIGGVCECIGYVGRILNSFEHAGCWSLGPYIIQTILILIGPAFMAASIYMILGRIILLTDGEKYSLIRRRWLTKIFVLGDVISLFLQASGGGKLSSGKQEDVDQGERMIIIGLFVQLAFFGFFIIVATIFHIRMRRGTTAKASDPLVRWQTYLITLYITSTSILIRSIFRVIEYLQGNDGYLISREAFLYIFDGLLMLVVVAWMNWFHPSEIGILLRGDIPATNGIKLLKTGGGHMSTTRL